MAFQTYHRKARCWNRPIVSVTIRGFTLNPIAVNKFGLENTPRVKLAYCGETHRIAICPAGEKDDSAYRLTVRKGARQIHAIGFMKLFELEDYAGCEMEYDEGDSRQDEIIFRFTEKPCRHNKKNPNTVKENTVKMEKPTHEKTAAPAPPRQKRVDYECVACGHENPVWKYNKSMQPLGHPETCPKCRSSRFEKITRRV